MTVYSSEVAGRRFVVELQDDGRKVLLDGIPVIVDGVWLAGKEQVHFLMNGRSFDLRILEENGHLVVTHAGLRYECTVMDKYLADLQRQTATADGPRGRTIVKSPMPGLVVKVLLDEGAEVRKGERILVLEAMKMENDVKAPVSGKISKLSVKAGEVVEGGRELAVIE